MDSSDLTIHYAALWEFPWNNGLSLHAGQMAEKFSEWLKTSQHAKDKEPSKEKEISLLHHSDASLLYVGVLVTLLSYLLFYLISIYSLHLGFWMCSTLITTYVGIPYIVTMS
jgi:hypothetical protein